MQNQTLILAHRHIAPDNKCTICGEVETIIHSLFFYKYAMEVWNVSDFVLLIQDAPKISFAEMLLWLVGKVNRDELQHFVTLSWASWTCRNKQNFEALSPSAVHVAAGFCKLVEDTRECSKNAQIQGRQHPRVLSDVAWKKPESGW